MSSVVIRRATTNDLPAAAALGAEIIRLHHATNPRRFFPPENAEEGYKWWLTQELARPQAVVLVAELDGIVVGYTYGTLEERDFRILADHHAVIQDLCVATPARHHGIGRQLTVAMIAALEALGVERVLLYAMVQNEHAQRLAESLGFAPTMVEMTRERR
jgi:ribosomal protein S18 acetylase RimI-like enzyme